jgi:hypothetical protein
MLPAVTPLPLRPADRSAAVVGARPNRMFRLRTRKPQINHSSQFEAAPCLSSALGDGNWPVFTSAIGWSDPLVLGQGDRHKDTIWSATQRAADSRPTFSSTSSTSSTVQGVRGHPRRSTRRRASPSICHALPGGQKCHLFGLALVLAYYAKRPFTAGYAPLAKP